MKFACRLEAISRPKVMTSDDSTDKGRRRDRFARVVEGPHNELLCDVNGRIGQLGATLDSCCKEMDCYRLENAWLRDSMEQSIRTTVKAAENSLFSYQPVQPARPV